MFLYLFVVVSLIMTKKRKAPKSQKQKSRSKRAGTKKQALQRLQDNIKSLEENKFNSKKFHNVLFDKLLADVDTKHHRDILLKICKNMNISSKKCKHKNAQELAELLRISIRYKSLKSSAITMLVLLGGLYFGRHNLSRTTFETNDSKKLHTHEIKKKDNIIPFKGSILDMGILPNCILVDPAGTAFDGQSNYTGGGFSGAIYEKFKLLNKSHKLTLNTTEALCNPEEINGIIHLVHVIGPNGQDDKYKDAEHFKNDLDKTIISLKNVLVEINKKKHPIALPLISGSIFRPLNLSLNDYMKMYIDIIRNHLSDYTVHLGLYSTNEQEAYKAV